MALRLGQRGIAALAAAVLATAGLVALAGVTKAQEPPHSAELDAAIVRAAKRHGVPERLVRRIVMRESRYNARARNHSFWGLMQISYPTARSMGFRGTPEELLNPVTNLTYAVPYLANAFVAAGQREDAAVRLYASGYYATAKSRGVLGMLRTAASAPLNGIRDEAAPRPAAVADNSVWSLFGASPSPAEPAPPSAATPQLAYAAAPDSAAAASPAQAQIQAAVASSPGPAASPKAGRDGGRHGGKSVGAIADKNGNDGVAMIGGRDGALLPPRRWQHDGGTTVIARGEQATGHGTGTETVTLGRGHRSRKTTVFAEAEPAAGSDAGPAVRDAQSAYATPVAGDASSADTARAAAAQVATAEAAGTPAAGDPPVDEAPGQRRHRRRHKSDD